MMANLLPPRERCEFYLLSQAKQNNSNGIPTMDSKIKAFFFLVSNTNNFILVLDE